MDKAKTPKSETTLKEVRLYSLSTTVNECVCFLEVVETRRVFALWTGIPDGQASAIHFSAVKPSRPLAHDLMPDMAETLGGTVSRVVISDLRENTFYAHIEPSKDGELRPIDARPSDAIALAVRAAAPIFVEAHVLDRCLTVEKPRTEEDRKKLQQKLNPSSLSAVGVR